MMKVQVIFNIEAGYMIRHLLTGILDDRRELVKVKAIFFKKGKIVCKQAKIVSHCNGDYMYENSVLNFIHDCINISFYDHLLYILLSRVAFFVPKLM